MNVFVGYVRVYGGFGLFFFGWGEMVDGLSVSLWLKNNRPWIALRQFAWLLNSGMKNLMVIAITYGPDLALFLFFFLFSRCTLKINYSHGQPDFDFQLGDLANVVI